MTNLYVLYAMLMAGGSGYVAKKVMDRHDPMRGERKNLLRFAKQLMLNEQRPVLINKSTGLGDTSSTKAMGTKPLSTLALPEQHSTLPKATDEIEDILV
jgi:hypothetical protein